MSGIRANDELDALVAARAMETALIVGDNSTPAAVDSPAGIAHLLLVEGSGVGRRRALALVARLLEACCIGSAADAADVATADDVAGATELAAAYLQVIPAAVWEATTEHICSVVTGAAAVAGNSGGGGGGGGGSAVAPCSDAVGNIAHCSTAEPARTLSSQECLEVYDYLRVVHAAAMITNRTVAGGSGTDDTAAAGGSGTHHGQHVAATLAGRGAAGVHVAGSGHSAASLVAKEAHKLSLLFVNALGSFSHAMGLLLGTTDKSRETMVGGAVEGAAGAGAGAAAGTSCSTQYFPALQHELLSVLRELLSGDVIEGPSAVVCLATVLNPALFSQILFVRASPPQHETPHLVHHGECVDKKAATQSAAGKATPTSTTTTTTATTTTLSAPLSRLQCLCLWRDVILVASLINQENPTCRESAGGH